MGNLDFRDPNVQIAGMVTLVAVALGAIFFATSVLPFGFQPRSAAIVELDAEYERISADLMKAKQTASRLPQVKSEYEALVARWDEAKTLLPTEKEMADLLTQVTLAGQRSGVDFILFEPKAPMPKEIYLENPIAVTVQGGYHDVGMFLSRVSNLNRIVNVKKMEMKNIPNPVDPDLPELVEASLDLAAYMLAPAQSAPAPGQAQGNANQANVAKAAATKGGNHGH